MSSGLATLALGALTVGKMVRLRIGCLETI